MMVQHKMWNHIHIRQTTKTSQKPHYNGTKTYHSVRMFSGFPKQLGRLHGKKQRR